MDKNNYNISDNVIIRFAGDSGDGMQLTGGRFTQHVASSGNNLSTFPDYPAEIRAPAGSTFGVSSFQIAFSDKDVLSTGHKYDVLVAMNPAALKTNIAELSKNGTIIIDKGQFTSRNISKAGYDTNPIDDQSLSNCKSMPIDITTLTHEAIKNIGLGKKESMLCRNMWVLGLVLWLYDKNPKLTENFLKAKLKNNNLLLEGNIIALRSGHAYAETIELPSGIVQRHIPKAKMEKGTYRTITGSEGISMGIQVAAKLSKTDVLFCSYPITPASPILHYLSKNNTNEVNVFQAEDEISACCAAIGASYAGNIGITSSSGPGIALKSEAMGLAIMTELPLVVINSQRAGPSTGMPTRTEQADLFQALYGRNGETPLAILAPATPSDCFTIAIEAIRIAIKFMSTVVILSDGFLANASEPWKIPNVNSLKLFPTRFYKDKNNFLPFSRDPMTLARPWVKPGTPGLEHRIGGLEKSNITGNISYDPENHEIMTKLRRKKIERISKDLNLLDKIGEEKGKLLILGWGSTYGPIREVAKYLLNKNKHVAHIHIKNISPLPAELGKILKNYEKIIVPEMNSGQLVKIIRSEYLLDAIPISNTTGKPFFSNEIITKINNILGEL